MRIFRLSWLAIAARFIAIALLPQLAASTAGTSNITAELVSQEAPQITTEDARASVIYQNLLEAYKPKTLQRAQVLPRAPVETPPTEYLPYPPPPNYVWPPGPHTQYPPPSETNAPAGWYGGTGTGGQGNSGAGSASNVNSGSGSTSAASSLRIPNPLRLPINLLFTYLPTSLLAPLGSPLLSRRSSSSQQQDYVSAKALEVRAPVETPPTEYLPYPPPPNYQWPPGMTPQNENPQPSEFDPPPGWYTGQTNQGGQGSGSGGNNNGNANTNGGDTNTGAGAPNQGAAYQGQYPYAQQQGGGGGGIGKGHLAWILVVTILATGVVVGGLAYRRGKKKGAGGGIDDDGGEKGTRIGGALAKLRFWGKRNRSPPPPPPAAAEAPAAE
ncbi:MAG: hypothetical protein L6R41_001724 [Letrouitia leprolyta]|nr:MAG: hypothetical protein L6R41_001724 [Letrouitia leprolyta]